MNKKRKKIVLLVLLTLFLVGGGIVFYQHTIQVQAAEAQKEVLKIIQLAKNNTEQLYSNEKKELLSDSITNKKVKDAESSISATTPLSLNKTEKRTVDSITEEVKNAKLMFEIQSSIHNKFNHDKITSDSLDFSDDEKNLILLKDNKPLFVKKMYKLIDQSKQQLAIKQALILFFEDYDNLETLATLSRSDFESLKESIDSLSSEPFKSDLMKPLEVIERAIEQQEQEAKEEAEKIEKEQKEAEKAQLEKERKTKIETEEILSTTTDSVSITRSNEASQDKANVSSETNSTPSSNQVESTQQTGIEGLIARSSTSQRTNQIIGVVANGSSSTVYLVEKNGTQWQTILSAPGRVGYNGVGSAYEGSGRTPKGAYSLGFAFGIGPNPGTNLTYRQITGSSYWISNPNDSQYNTW